MTEWMLDELMDAWDAVQQGKVTGDVRVVMAALDAANLRIINLMPDKQGTQTAKHFLEVVINAETGEPIGKMLREK